MLIADASRFSYATSRFDQIANRDLGTIQGVVWKVL
jgi:hypothetical protein